jgi:hypothetical protein
MALLRWPHKDKPPVLLKVRSSAGLIVTTCSFAIFTVSRLLLFDYGAVQLTSPGHLLVWCHRPHSAILT